MYHIYLCHGTVWHKLQNRGIIMNIIMWIVIILGGILGIAVTLGTVAGMVGVIIYKICRKIRYGISLYD